ncbi:GNAT family N-acetyltransferase [Oryzibacter oryziterrae]|uniref:GNAT family N-acetyltransferase n=1 Tax=Oryzibacter oryziterrae TaxID=2766474 RepID=UPI001EFF7503|nr:GNAT family N-acetyltransferase [Oryzibacter oryziterrae]
MTDSRTLAIRPARDADTDALYEICRRTADAGQDATDLMSDPRLAGDAWAVAYLKFAPDFAFVLTAGDAPIGYVLATDDSLAFGARLDRDWWPAARARIEGREPTSPMDAMAMGRIRHSEPTADWLVKDYPAHLHINVLPQAQASGWGRRMIETELDALRAAGVRGVHLGVHPSNTKAMGFYRHVGFTDLSRDGHVIFGMKFTD